MLFEGNCMKKSFTMIELIFVIIIIGILAGVAFPKLFSTLDDSKITKARTDVSNIRSAILSLHSKDLMKGLNYYPDTLDEAEKDTEDESLFEGNHSKDEYLLDYPIYSKKSNGHWMKTDDTNYTIKLQNTDVKFNYYKSNGHFDCEGLNSNKADDLCKKLTH